MSSTTHERPPPRLLVVVSLGVLGLASVLAVLGALRTGITTDEPIHVMRLRNFFETGWYALDWDYRGDGPGSEGTNTFVYGPVAMLLLHGWSALCGAESWGEVSASAHAYDVRHLGVVLIGLVGLAAVVAIGRVVLRQWRWGLVAAAVLAAIPMWTGHQMFNVKDVPVATGSTLVTLGLLVYLRYETPARWLRVARAATLAAGLVLTMGTRPGMWPGILAAFVVVLVGIRFANPGRRQALVTLGELAAGCAVAAGALVAIYPKLFGSPLEALPRTSESSSSFLDGLKSDRSYVPRKLAEEMPTLLLVFVVTGMVVGLLLLVNQWRWSPVPAFRIALVGVQTAALPVAAVVMGSDLYHGLRQLLFAAPTAAVLGAVGMAWWLRRGFRGAAAVPAVAAAALVLPMVDQVTLQPYQTTYVNLATDVIAAPYTGPLGRPGGDYWRSSIPELVDGTTVEDQLVCKSLVTPLSKIAYRFTNGGTFSTSRSLDCRQEPNGPLAPSGIAIPTNAVGREFAAVIIGPLPANCTAERDVSRYRHGFKVVLTTLAQCTSRVATLTSTGVVADSPDLGTAKRGDLWRYAADGWEQWPGDRAITARMASAVLGFRPLPVCTRTGCDLVLGTVADTVPEDLTARVSSDDVPVRRAADGTLLIAIDPDHADANGVWVTLSRRTGEALGLQVTGLRLAPPEGP